MLFAILARIFGLKPRRREELVKGRTFIWVLANEKIEVIINRRPSLTQVVIQEDHAHYPEKVDQIYFEDIDSRGQIIWARYDYLRYQNLWERVKSLLQDLLEGWRSAS